MGGITGGTTTHTLTPGGHPRQGSNYARDYTLVVYCPMSSMQPYSDPQSPAVPSQDQDAWDLLDTREKLFIDAYLGDAQCNGTEAARIAGYSPDMPENWHTQAWRLLRKTTIAQVIEARLEALGAPAHKRMLQLAVIAEGDTTNALKDIVKSMGEDTSAIARIDQRLIKRIRVQGGNIPSIDIELHDRIDAIKELNRMQGIGTSRQLQINHTGTGNNPITLIRMYDAPPRKSRHQQQPTITTMELSTPEDTNIEGLYTSLDSEEGIAIGANEVVQGTTIDGIPPASEDV